MRRPSASKMLSPLGMALVLAARAHAGGLWPPFLPPPEEYPAFVVAGVERVWSAPTLRRSVEAEPAPVPFGTYVVFVDAPDLTAAAARHLGLAKYEVQALDDDWYAADDGDGARGVYHVLVREGGRRVILSWGRHRGAILGTVTGSALTVVDLDDRGASTGQRLTAHVLIDNRAAAALARALVAVFGFIADRKLTEGFRVTSRVAAWAAERPEEFCPWLAHSSLPDDRIEALLDTLPHCRPASAAVTPRAP